MHGTTFAGAQWRTRSGRCSCWTRTLKYGLTRDGPAGRGTRCTRGCCRRSRANRRFVDRTRTGLRNDHSWRRHVRALGRRRCRGPCSNRSLGSRWWSTHSSGRRNRSCRNCRRWRRRSRRSRSSGNRRGRRLNSRRRCRNCIARPCRSNRCNHSCRRWRRRGRWRDRRSGRRHRHSSRLGFNWGRRRGTSGRSRWRRGLLSANGVQYIAGAGNMGKINFSFNFVAFRTAGPRGLAGRRCFARG